MDLYTVEFKLPGESELRSEEIEAESEAEARTIIDRNHKPAEIVSLKSDSA
ncbi:hypothetical protein [Chromohalobacter moromii]|uniref:Uncharacterized protein n=1 Tax=Chromohalobacter moromii TaxID=2860329 RepID=A0A9X3B6Y4_9GAMM|nr:hypothetical protein [Chromohalobacter moromii]MCK2046612.1 hypothetical protein [Chromohalobacter moromii]MCT8506188.1 hypothetical protein [Chromohalobacter moromii]